MITMRLKSKRHVFIRQNCLSIICSILDIRFIYVSTHKFNEFNLIKKNDLSGNAIWSYENKEPMNVTKQY